VKITISAGTTGTIHSVNDRAIHEFVKRPWRDVASAKTAYWAERFARDRQATWVAAQALLDHMRRIQPDFPTDRDRDADFGAHLSLRSCLDRAAHAFARR
jgi:hypothetical protein